MYLELQKSHLDNFENHTVGLSPTLTNWNKIAGERDWHLTYKWSPGDMTHKEGLDPLV